MRQPGRWHVPWALIIAIAIFPVALQAQTPEEGEMRYAEKPIEHEFLVQIDLDTGAAQLTAESALRLKRLRETGTIDFVRSIDVELHPAPVEAGILGSHGISPE